MQNRELIFILLIIGLGFTLKKVKSQQADPKLDNKWTEPWDSPRQHVNLVFNDTNVVVYFDHHVNPNITWPFQLLSLGWDYCKNTFGPLIFDPVLYFVLHERNSSCIVSFLGELDYKDKYVIHCGPSSEDKVWDSQSTQNVVHLIKALGRLVLASAARSKEQYNNIMEYANFEVALVDIIAYDVHLNLNSQNYPMNWSKKIPSIKQFYDTYSFKSEPPYGIWNYPTYTRYGTKALKKFISVITSNLTTDDTYFNFRADMNPGVMVHFWSYAAGENLWRFAARMMDWNHWIYKRFLKAQIDFPQFNYSNTFMNSNIVVPPEILKETWFGHNSFVSLVHLDANMAIYNENRMTSSIDWPFLPISDALNYAKKTYGNLDNDPFLYLILHHDNKSSNKNISTEIPYKSDVNLAIVDYVSGFDSRSTEGLTQLIQQVSAAVTKAKRLFLYDSLKVNYILVFDILLGSGLIKEAVRYLKETIATEGSIFGHWYYPIYVRYGRSKVLKSFLNLIFSYWPNWHEEIPITWGLFVHFWSGAAGVNLKPLAIEAFKWGPDKDKSVKNAIGAFPMVQYKDSQEKSYFMKIIISSLGFSTNYFLAHSGPNLGVYIEDEVNSFVEWPFGLLSSIWAVIIKSYQVVFITNQPLYVTLMIAPENGCATDVFEFRNGVSNINTSFVTCSRTRGNGWKREEPKNKDDLVNGIVKFVAEKVGQIARNELEKNLAFMDTLAFDIYMQIEQIEDAYRLLEESVQKYERRLWILNWYLPIYISYGGVSGFNNFLSFMAINWTQFNEKQNKIKLNKGQLVHLWSYLVNDSLFSLAESAFGRSELLLLEFNQAREEFGHLSYLCYDCHLESKPGEENSLIVGLSISIGGIVFAAVFILLLLYRFGMQRIREQMRELTVEEIESFFDGNQNLLEADGNACIDSKPFSPEFEIPREQLVFSSKDILGKGTFGLIIRGSLQRDQNTPKIIVAIKTVTPNVDVTNFKALLSELKVFGFLGSHSNIVALVGACTTKIKNRELYVALEYCAKGDLCRLLIKHRKGFRDLFKKKPEDQTGQLASLLMTGESETTFATSPCVMSSFEVDSSSISTLNSLQWSIQAAQGMAFIASKKVIHGDLAARNILITADNVAKIGDFGLSRQLVNYSNYMKKSHCPLPWRWMAIESLRDMNFSVQSDVWSFGVTLYEIFSLGTTPFAGYSWNQEFLDQLVAGQRLSPPKFGNININFVMLECMTEQPSKRITYPEIVEILHEIEVKVALSETDCDNCSYIRLN